MMSVMNEELEFLKDIVWGIIPEKKIEEVRDDGHDLGDGSDDGGSGDHVGR